MVSVARLGYLGLGVSSINEWERFATEVLGLQPNGRDGEDSLFLRMDEYHHRFVLHQNGNDDLDYVGWEVAGEQELQALAQQLRGAGHEVVAGSPEQARARRVAGLIKFSDPNSIACEIFYGPLVTFESPFNSPQPISGFETGDMGLGHIVVGVDDLERSLHFYRDVLGMRISDFVEVERAGAHVKLAFFHCNPRHHSLAFMAGPGPKRLHHFMIQLKSIDDVGRAYYRCQERSIPIAMTLGRHVNDHMVSFYAVSPSGFTVEYGWGARVVDDRTWAVQTHQAASVWGHVRLQPPAAGPGAPLPDAAAKRELSPAAS